jgi:hypothetical protein
MGPHLAGVQGFEPRFAVPETTVLPLDDTPLGGAYEAGAPSCQRQSAATCGTLNGTKLGGFDDQSLLPVDLDFGSFGPAFTQQAFS